MFKFRRFAYILLIVGFISIGFFLISNSIFNVKHDFSNKYNNTAETIDIKSIDFPLNVESKKYLVLYNDIEASEKSTYLNTIEALEALKVTYLCEKQVTKEHLLNIDTLIIATKEFTTAISSEDIGNFVTSGGEVLFAGGISENTMSMYLNPILGIIERGFLYNSQGLFIKEGFFPTGALNITEAIIPYSSTSVRLKDTCKIYVTDSDNNPIIWTNEYREGRIGVINGNIVEDKAAMGLLVGALSAIQEHMIYPIIGTKAAFLDDFPPNKRFKTSKLLEYYGRNSESLVRDILLPSFLKAALDNDIYYTAFFMESNDHSTTSKLVNNDQFSYNAKEILKYGGEIGIGGDDSLDNVNYGAIDKFTKATIEDVFKNYYIRCYSPIYGRPTSERLNELKKAFNHITILRGTYFGDKDTQLVQTFNSENHIVNYPYITNGYELTDRTLFLHGSMVTTYGIVSHSFRTTELINPTSDAYNWNHLEKPFLKLCSELFGKYQWLESVTCSEGAYRIKSYESLKTLVQVKDNDIWVYCKNFVSGQTFFIRSEANLSAISGCTITKISENYYIVNATDPLFKIDKEG